jgi:hypothetical protein
MTSSIVARAANAPSNEDFTNLEEYVAGNLFRTVPGSEPYSVEQFEMLLELTEPFMGGTLQEIEKSKVVRNGANTKSEQYGRILPCGIDVSHCTFHGATISAFSLEDILVIYMPLSCKVIF